MFALLSRTSIILTFSINNVNTFYKVFFKVNTLKTAYHLHINHFILATEIFLINILIMIWLAI